MSFTHAQILAMEAAGLTREQLLALIKADAQVEEDKAAKRRVGAAERKRRQRDREKSRNVTRDTCDTPAPSLDGRPPSPTPQPPTLNPSPAPGSDPGGSAADAADGQREADPRGELFARGVKAVAALTGRSEATARSAIAHWLWLAQDEAGVVLALIDEAGLRRLFDPSMWIVRQLKLRQAQGRGDDPPPDGPPGGRRHRPGPAPSGRAAKLMRLAEDHFEEGADAEHGSDDRPSGRSGPSQPHRGTDRGVPWVSGAGARPSDSVLRAAAQGGHDHKAAAAYRRAKAP